MILANGLYGNPGGHKPTPRPTPTPTAAQRRVVDTWAARRLADIPKPELETALEKVSAHPDAYTEGYSRPKATRERLAAELASRP
jgi:hypothetical protein